MAVYQGTHWSQKFTAKTLLGAPIDVSTWLLEADLRRQVSDVTPLMTLTSANGGFTVLDGPAGSFRMDLTPEQTEILPAGGVVFDVLRTELSDGPVFLFSAKFKAKQPVTR